MATKTTKPLLTLGGVKREYATEDACKELLVTLRWPDGKITCPRKGCGEQKRVYKTSQPFRWKCKACAKDGYKFSVLTGSVFENTNVPLRIWFEVAFLMVSSKKGISALQVHRMIDPVRGKKGSYKTAWYMCHRLRAAMQDGDFFRMMGGVQVEIDETYVGGKERNKHVGKRGAWAASGKVGVVGAVARKGNVVCKVIGSADASTIKAFVRKTVASDVSLVATDEHPAYRTLTAAGYNHETVSHRTDECVRGNVHTQNLDSFWSLLKRGIIGTYHKVSANHLPLYLNEFSWRHNNRHNEEIFHALLAGC